LRRAAVLVLGAVLLGVLLVAFRKSDVGKAEPLTAGHAQPVFAQAHPMSPSQAAASTPVPIPDLPRAATSVDSLRALVDRDPALALAKIQGMVPERETDAQRLLVLEVHALVKLGRIGVARTRAGVYYERWPEGPEVSSLESLTGLHPTPPTSDQDRPIP
jgi:hypothetical protein